MPTSNNDTFYMSAIVDLTEPFILSVPDTNDRYYVVDVFNMWQELEHYIGRRVTGTGPEVSRSCPPGWTGELPAGVTRLDVATDKIWLWGRLRLTQGEDVAPVLALQKEFRLTSLSAFGKAEQRRKQPTLPALPDIAGDELGFFTQLGAAVKANPIKPADEALFAQFARYRPDKKRVRSLETRSGPAQGTVARLAGRTNGRDLGVPERGRATQRLVLGDRTRSFRLRLPAARPRLRPLSRRPGREGGDVPAALHQLVEQSAERREQLHDPIRLSAPVDAFWSLTVYNAGDKLLVDNPIGRYKIGSDTKGLVTAADGSITLKLSHAAPAGEAAKNWLPTPDGPFYLVLRLYQPKADILKGVYQLPEVVNDAPATPATSAK